MGSQLVIALVEQRSVGKTNPDNVSPSPNHVITQEAQQKSSSFTSAIEQASVRTALAGGVSTSKPIEQLRFGRATVTPAAVIEQRFVSTSTNPASSQPIEQFICRVTGTKPLLQQLNVQTSPTSSKPIEQVAQVSTSINIEQFDFIDLIFPACGSIRNPVNTDILWRVNDFGFPFDVNTLVFKVNGIEVQDSPSFVVTPVVNGIQIDYDPPEDFAYDSEVPVYLEILDTAPEPNRFVAACSFFTTIDSAGPQILNFTLCRQVGVGTRAVVEFDVLDFQTGVDRDSIELNIESIGICDGLLLDPITTASGNGYHVTWEHSDAPFRYGSTVTAAVTAADVASPPNRTQFVCRFQIEESTPPEFINFDPGPCETFVDNTTGLTFEVYGIVDGVDITTLEVVVDNKRRRVLVRPRIRRYE